MERYTEQKIKQMIEHYRLKNLSDEEIVLLIRGIFLQCGESELNSIFQKTMDMKFEETSLQLQLDLYPFEKEGFQNNKEKVLEIKIPAALLENIPKSQHQDYVIRLIKADRGL